MDSPFCWSVHEEALDDLAPTGYRGRREHRAGGLPIGSARADRGPGQADRSCQAGRAGCREPGGLTSGGSGRVTGGCRIASRVAKPLPLAGQSLTVRYTDDQVSGGHTHSPRTRSVYDPRR